MLTRLLIVLFLLVSASLRSVAQPEPSLTTSAQNSEPTFSVEGVWHKNMELICPVAGVVGAENFSAIPIGSGYYLVMAKAPLSDINRKITEWGFVRVTDVTNPRSISHPIDSTAGLHPLRRFITPHNTL